MFNRELKYRIASLESIVAKHEGSIHKLKHFLSSRIEIENFPMDADTPSGFKIMFTFNNEDGTPNGGICNHPNSLPDVFKMVRLLNGRNLVIRDETVYLNADHLELVPK